MSAPVLETAARVSLSASVMILAAAALRLRFGRRTSSRVFCLLWDIILCRLLLLTDIPSPVSIQRLLALRPRESGTAPVVIPSVIFYEGDGVLQAGALHTAARPPVDWTGVLTAVWLAGVILGLGWVLWNHLRSRRVYAASLPVEETAVRDWQAAHRLRRPVQVRCSDQIASPLTYGLVYPVVLLPRRMDWTDRDLLACVLSHEYTHIRRLDALRRPLLTLALCLHWFNPLVWAMYVLACRDMELTCDEAAVRGGADRRCYALALLSMEEERGRTLSGSRFSGNGLEERIEAIVRGRRLSLTALLSVLVVMSIATTVFAAGAPADWGTAPLEEREAAIITGVMEEDQAHFSAGSEDTWQTIEGYHALYGDWGDDWAVEWWTYDAFKRWLDQEREALQEMIGDRCYTSSDGWFVWDQQQVDDAVALYEDILEDIKNGALYSREVQDKDGHILYDVSLASGGPVGAFVQEAGEGSPAAPEGETCLEDLQALGIEGTEDTGLTYRGQLVRCLVDGAALGESEYAVRYLYTNDQGTVDVHTLRRPVPNGDGSYDPMGELTGLAAAGEAGFDQGLVECALFQNIPQAAAVGARYRGHAGGRSFEEIFAQYESWGLIYQPRDDGRGGLFYDSQPVQSFADLKPGGGVFSYEDPYAEGGLRVRTQYDQQGRLSGLEVA